MFATLRIAPYCGYIMQVTTQLQRLLRQSDKLKQRMVKSLLRTMKQIDQQRKERVADLDHAAKIITKELADLGHRIGVTKPGKKTAAGRKAKGRRIRRSSEQLKAEATKVLALIRKAGKNGIRGSEIRKSHAGVGQNIKAFVEKNTGEKIKTTGAKASMKYHI